MHKNRHITLQADNGVARDAGQHLEPLVLAPAVPQRLVGIATEQRLGQGVEHKAGVGGERAEVGRAIIARKGRDQIGGGLQYLARAHQRCTTPGSTQSISYSRLAPSSEVLPLVS